ncbi:transposase family protein [Candidatus Poriferisodalis sp.]
MHDRRERRTRDLGVPGRPVASVWNRRRMACESCGRRD